MTFALRYPTIGDFLKAESYAIQNGMGTSGIVIGLAHECIVTWGDRESCLITELEDLSSRDIQVVGEKLKVLTETGNDAITPSDAVVLAGVEYTITEPSAKQEAQAEGFVQRLGYGPIAAKVKLFSTICTPAISFDDVCALPSTDIARIANCFEFFRD